MMSASTYADFLHMTEKFSYMCSMRERAHPSPSCTHYLIMTLWALHVTHIQHWAGHPIENHLPTPMTSRVNKSHDI